MAKRDSASASRHHEHLNRGRLGYFQEFVPRASP